MNNRILKIRKDNHLTQDAFAEKLNLSKNFVWMLEKGERIPSDRTILDICREFGVNELWLRTGEEPMLKTLLPEDEIAAAVSNVLEDIKCDNSIYTLVKELLLKYENLDQTSKKVLDKYVDDVLKGYIEKREEQ